MIRKLVSTLIVFDELQRPRKNIVFAIDFKSKESTKMISLPNYNKAFLVDL